MVFNGFVYSLVERALQITLLLEHGIYRTGTGRVGKNESPQGPAVPVSD